MSVYQYVRVGGMSESKYGIETLKTIIAESLGNYTVLFSGPWNNQSIQEAAQFCREKLQRGLSTQITFSFK